MQSAPEIFICTMGDADWFRPTKGLSIDLTNKTFTENNSIEQIASETDEHDAEDRRKIWTKPATELMLALTEDILPDLGESDELRTKTQMYQIIAKEMRKEGYAFSASQVEYKFRAIEKQYKRRNLIRDGEELQPRKSKKQRKEIKPKANSEQKSDTEVVWMYNDGPEMSSPQEVTIEPAADFRGELAKDDGLSSPEQYAVEPDVEYRVEQTEDVKPVMSSQEQILIEPDVDYRAEQTKDDGLSNSNTGEKGNSSVHLNKIFSKMATERRKYHAQVVNFLNRKEERAQSREKRDQKKLELLERLLEKGV